MKGGGLYGVHKAVSRFWWKMRKAVQTTFGVVDGRDSATSSGPMSIPLALLDSVPPRGRMGSGPRRTLATSSISSRKLAALFTFSLMAAFSRSFLVLTSSVVSSSSVGKICAEADLDALVVAAVGTLEVRAAVTVPNRRGKV